MPQDLSLIDLGLWSETHFNVRCWRYLRIVRRCRRGHRQEIEGDGMIQPPGSRTQAPGDASAADAES
ncbi:hypothetical protein IE4872_PD01992 (plasmid) [Rhizobium gallicum]|uniref:Uncharacterized protein n=1 Tax=Rhizobium gallicum TaxID=56730 RepID=A0A1L5NXB3_9HYPH|nr:hypothetical protein IE4872_PD01992 [Rhizobium gallicum]